MATDTSKPTVKEEASSNARKSPSTATPADQRGVSPRPPTKKEESSSSERHAPSNPNDNNKNVSSTSPVPPRPASASSIHSNGRSTAVNITNSQPNRPPSSASAHSGNSGTGAPRTTATSRRGGRTRCRSPPTMITHRPGSAGPPPPPADPYSPRQMDDRPPPPPPVNPSAAAAAAAAAAKSITRTPPPPSSWYESAEAGGRDYGRRPHRGEGPPPPSSRYPPQHHMPRDHRYGYEGGAMPPSSRWPPPGEDGRPSSRTGRPGGGGDPRYGSYRRGEDHYGYREGAYFARRGGRSDYPPYDEHMEYDRRYQDHPPPPHGGAPYDDPHRSSRRPVVERGETSPYGREDPYGRNSSRDRLRPPTREHTQREHPPREHPREHQRQEHREDPYYPKEQEGSRAAAGAPTTVKRTTRVIGTATPIHMPRASEPQSRPRRESAASEIFRGRPGSEVRPSSRSEPAEESPQKILMALRTPSTSFEEKQSNKRSDAPLSPEAPPQMSRNTDFNLSFEPQASPKSQAGPPQPTSSIDMAPSFNLFNQSFDSIGDTAGFFNVDGPLGSALAQSTSFGVPSASLTDDKISDQLQLHPSSSGGNFTQQLLGGSGSAGLTFGMSPSNSFGGAGPPPSSRGSSNVVRLGGEDHRSADQVLDMYRSYSGGASPRVKPGGSLDESHIRMSGTNLGSPIVANPSYNRSFSEAPPPAHYSNRAGPPQLPDGANGPLGFYVFLRRHKGAFRDVMFLLPGLKAALLEAPDVKKDAEADTPKRQTRNSDPYGEPSPQEIAIARRRIACAVCAFGGTNTGDRPPTTSPQQKDGNAQSIFREKPGDTATVTPNSSASTNPGNRQVSRQRAKYEEILPSRYYENDNRLSWEFEENPPIGEIGDDDGELDGRNKDGSNDKSKSGNSDGRGSRADGDDTASQTSSAENGKKTSSSGNKEDQPKMKYRCKLCGQPKQNHTCPYQQSLARSIGTMIYPAVNAFTAAEPGLLAPALSEMNNFMISGSESVSSAETSPSRPTPDRMRRMNQGIPPGTAQVTPESIVRSTRGANSPLSAVSGGTSTPQRNRTPGSSKRKKGTPCSRPTPGSVTSATSSKRRRTHPPTGVGSVPGGGGPGAGGGPGGGNGSEDQGDLLFVESVELKPEQFRIVSQMKVLASESAFTYAPLPLPYAQRKRLSDNLFSLSKQVPQLTDECATVLREAREKDLWDLAVAELMTQVVVVAHCAPNMADSRFDGLRRYLLTLGISC